MIWDRFKNYKCPGCNGGLEANTVVEVHFCKKCGYKIGFKKFNSIVEGLHALKKSKEKTEEENLSDLNNL